VEQQPKKRKVGRPRFPRAMAKSRIVPVRFSAEDLKAMTVQAKASRHFPNGYAAR
jgi:hypothetical protein